LDHLDHINHGKALFKTAGFVTLLALVENDLGFNAFVDHNGVYLAVANDAATGNKVGQGKVVTCEHSNTIKVDRAFEVVHVDVGLLSFDCNWHKSFHYLVKLLLYLGAWQLGFKVPFAIELGSLNITAATNVGVFNA
jgi:hypothetical protein